MSLAFDPDAAVAHLKAGDRRLAQWMDRVGPYTYRPPRLHSPFHMLLRAIISQQLSMKAANTIYQRVLALHRRPRGPHPDELLSLHESALRGAGMSRAKVAAIRDLAERTLSGDVPPLATLRKMTDEAIVERLVAVRGVGVWTVEMLLIFKLGRPDVLPVGDLGIRKGFALVHASKTPPTVERLLRLGERWRPYRSVASWYLWRALEVAAKKD